MTLDLEELERLLAEATPGPWRFVQTGIDYGYVGPDGETTVLFGEASEGAVEENDPDALALVALRNAAPELLALARRGQASASPSADELAGALEAALKQAPHSHLCAMRVGDDEDSCDCWCTRARALLARRRAP